MACASLAASAAGNCQPPQPGPAHQPISCIKAAAKVPKTECADGFRAEIFESPRQLRLQIALRCAKKKRQKQTAYQNAHIQHLSGSSWATCAGHTTPVEACGTQEARRARVACRANLVLVLELKPSLDLHSAEQNTLDSNKLTPSRSGREPCTPTCQTPWLPRGRLAWLWPANGSPASPRLPCLRRRHVSRPSGQTRSALSRRMPASPEASRRVNKTCMSE